MLTQEQEIDGPQTRRFLTISAAARRASVSESTIRRLLADGKLTAYHPAPRRVVIDVRELDAFVLATAEASAK